MRMPPITVVSLFTAAVPPRRGVYKGFEIRRGSWTVYLHTNFEQCKRFKSPRVIYRKERLVKGKRWKR